MYDTSDFPFLLDIQPLSFFAFVKSGRGKPASQPAPGFARAERPCHEKLLSRAELRRRCRLRQSISPEAKEEVTRPVIVWTEGGCLET